MIVSPCVVYSARTSPVISILLHPRYLPFKAWLRRLTSNGFALNKVTRRLNEILTLRFNLAYCLSKAPVVLMTITDCLDAQTFLREIRTGRLLDLR